MSVSRAVEILDAWVDGLKLMMRSVIQEINMASKPIKDPVTQAASCDVRSLKLGT